MTKLRMIGARIGTLDSRTAKPPPKEAERHYLTPEHRTWSDQVIGRAGGRCEDIDERTGLRCTKAQPDHRVFADHIVERRDGGQPFDLKNGQCLCGSHHGKKTAIARARRARASAG
ncbi:MAG: HNH endonuclease signature motif containing protein [Rhizomicrobium sp.]